MQEVLEKYLQRLRRFGYSEEQVEAAKEFREKSETNSLYKERVEELKVYERIN